MHRTKNIKEFAVIGCPLDQSMSPVLHTEVFNQLNINATYRKIEISKQKFFSQLSQKYIKKLTGFNVTTPHKNLIMDKLDFLDPIAEKIGALLDGNFELEITGLGSLDNCNEGDITFLSNNK